MVKGQIAVLAALKYDQRERRRQPPIHSTAIPMMTINHAASNLTCKLVMIGPAIRPVTRYISFSLADSHLFFASMSTR
jgi:hypothetical protein